MVRLMVRARSVLVWCSRDSRDTLTAPAVTEWRSGAQLSSQSTARQTQSVSQSVSPPVNNIPDISRLSGSYGRTDIRQDLHTNQL